MKRQVLLYILLAFTALSMCSCATKKRCDRKFPPVVSKSDSINTVETIIYKDTTVRDTIPGDTIKVPVPVECDPITNKPVNKNASIIHTDQFVDVVFGVDNNKPWTEVIRKPIYRDYLFQKIYAEKLKEHFSKSNTVTTVTDTIIPWWVWLICAVLTITNLFFAIKR